MSSVTMSITRREASNAPGDPAGRTRTRARPCGRSAASRACSTAAAATAAGPGRGQVLDRDVLVVRPEIAEQVPDVQAGRVPGADRLGRLG